MSVPRRGRRKRCDESSRWGNDVGMFDSLAVIVPGNDQGNTTRDAWDGPGQMALDEVLLGRVDGPTLRFYRWSDAWVSFGYFQLHAQVERMHPGSKLVRRWTGGGIVLHDGDLTFSLMIPAGHPVAMLPPAMFYALLHGGLAPLLGGTLAGESEINEGNSCFASPSRDDVMVSGSKVLGGALRRSGGALLYQGSLRLLSEEGSHRRHMEAIPAILAGELSQRILSPTEVEEAIRLADTKYATRGWNERR